MFRTTWSHFQFGYSQPNDVRKLDSVVASSGAVSFCAATIWFRNDDDDGVSVFFARPAEKEMP